jgi:hypothetical protein
VGTIRQGFFEIRYSNVPIYIARLDLFVSFCFVDFGPFSAISQPFFTDASSPGRLSSCFPSIIQPIFSLVYQISGRQPREYNLPF